MTLYDLEDWPLAISITPGPPTAAAHAALLATWTRWLARDERLAILHVGTGDGTDDTSAALTNWLRAQARPIGRQLLGLAAVAPDAALARAIRLNDGSLAGAPADVAPDVESALAFLRWLVAPPDGRDWCAATIAARVRRALRENPPAAALLPSRPPTASPPDDRHLRPETSPHQAGANPPQRVDGRGAGAVHRQDLRGDQRR